jgi:hypothetical protein
MLVTAGGVVGAVATLVVTDRDPGHAPVVLATVLVAVIVAVITAVTTDRRQARQVAHERELADLDDLRGVLDKAATWLHRTSYVLDDFYGKVHLSYVQSEDGQRMTARLRKCGRELDALYERLSVRLGREHPVTRTFKNADDAVLHTWRAILMLALEQTPDGDPYAARQVREHERERRDDVERSRQTFKTAWERFVEAAEVAAGARLSG